MSILFRLIYYFGLKMRLFLFSLLLVSLSACANTTDKTMLPVELAAVNGKNQCIVLIHGLWRSGYAMKPLQEYLNNYGFTTIAINYPSTETSIENLATNFVAPAVDECQAQGMKRIHFVTHSMGGIVARMYLQNHSLPENSRVVMLSPPNQGSEFSKRFGDTSWYEWLVGPAAITLTKDSNGVINSLKPIKEEVGIIAAYREWSLWPSSWLPEPNDGTVAVQNMRLAEMQDFILLEAGHAMMRHDEKVKFQIVHFLKHGRFKHTMLSLNSVNNL